MYGDLGAFFLLVFQRRPPRTVGEFVRFHGRILVPFVSMLLYAGILLVCTPDRWADVGITQHHGAIQSGQCAIYIRELSSKAA